jgi:hypothetical protein
MTPPRGVRSAIVTQLGQQEKGVPGDKEKGQNSSGSHRYKIIFMDFPVLWTWSVSKFEI